jgi:hypothetical protein
VIWGDAVFVTTQTADDKLLLMRIDKKLGQIVWSREVGSGTQEREGPKRHAQKFHKFYSPASPSPVTDGKVVVAHFGNGDLASYDFAGEQIWKPGAQCFRCACKIHSLICSNRLSKATWSPMIYKVAMFVGK